MLHCLILDQDTEASKALYEYIELSYELSLIGTYTDPIPVVQEIKNATLPLLIFVDAGIPLLSEWDASFLLPPTVAIVITSSHEKYAFKAFERNAWDFLLKPYSLLALSKSVAKVKARIDTIEANSVNDENDKIFIKAGFKNTIIQIALSEIIYIEAMDHYIMIHTHSNNYLTPLSLKEIHSILKLKRFLRVHKKYIVNSDYIARITGNQLFLINEENITLGETYKNLFFKSINFKR